MAGVGLVLLWMATQSMPWIDVSGGTLDLAATNTLLEPTGKYPVVEWFADWGWKLLFAYVLMAGVLATLFNPKSSGLRTLLWLPLTGPFALFNLTDRGGTAAPRVLGVLAMLPAAGLLAAVTVDLMVAPELDLEPNFENLAPEDLEGIDPSVLEDPSSVDPGSLDPGTLDALSDAGVGVNWQGFTRDDLGQAVYASFGAVALVGAGCIIGTRKAT